MRILLASALLVATASCAWASSADTAPAPAPVTLVPPPAPVVAQPGRVATVLPPGVTRTPNPAPAAPPPQAAAPVAPRLVAPAWTSWFSGRAPAAPPGRLTLSNFSFNLAHVEALVTPYPDCVIRPGMMPVDLKLPLNSTWIVPAVAGSDICWRRRIPPQHANGTPGWTGWNRAFTSFGRAIDARL